MEELHVLVDFENVQPPYEELANLTPGFTDVWLFHNRSQIKRAQLFVAAHQRVTPVPISRTGSNALDFHLTFYLGYVAARHPEAHLVVVSNDKGYEPMIVHAGTLGFTVQRVGFKAKKPAPAVKKPAAAKKAVPPAAKPPAAKIAAPPQTPTPAKKVPAKKAPAKKVPAKTVSAKKTAKPKASAPKVKAQPKAAAPAESKEFTRIKRGLAKMGDKAPHKLMSFLRHVKALLGKDSTAEEVDAVVEKLEQAGVVRVAGDLVLYGQD